MTKLMLIEATHPEEVRVVITEEGLIQEYDYVTETKQQLKGNIYLAKVTRVEPSLQAAFVEYGQERQGFLPFAEIHPDYYQIPLEDKQALLAEMAQNRAMEAEQRRHDDRDDDEDADDNRSSSDDRDMDDEEEEVEALSQDDDDSGRSRRRVPLTRRYKINEVIKKGQIMLVQVNKEERGNKGAALTSYLSLAGRYCVLMPNTAEAGGVSRKVTSHEDRIRLKQMMEQINQETPPGMSVIIRTAGADRSKPEIKRDFDYLQRVWNDIRDLTLQSTAPALVYEENDIIKRSIRDVYKTDIEQVVVAGSEGYKDAKNFMKMLMPSHAARVKEYHDDIPLFYAYDVEDQLNSMHEPIVHLPSGGYLVINPTEALVSVDVNSGRSTRERNVEETALRTNMEAARELARQLRLRDLAGLLVIDFIDMYEFRNRRQVEKVFKDALRQDRAKIQIGRISAFGLLEMSRQRMRPSLTEANSRPCDHCGGTGVVRSIPSLALQIIRAIEKEAHGLEAGSRLQIKMAHEVAYYLLNQKRDNLSAIEKKYGIPFEITGDTDMGQSFTLSRLDAKRGWVVVTPANGEPRRHRRAKPMENIRLSSSEDDDVVLDDVVEESNESRDPLRNIRKREPRSPKQPRQNNISQQLAENAAPVFEETTSKAWQPIPLETPPALAAREWHAEETPEADEVEAVMQEEVVDVPEKAQEKPAKATKPKTKAPKAEAKASPSPTPVPTLAVANDEQAEEAPVQQEEMAEKKANAPKRRGWWARK